MAPSMLVIAASLTDSSRAARSAMRGGGMLQLQVEQREPPHLGDAQGEEDHHRQDERELHRRDAALVRQEPVQERRALGKHHSNGSLRTATAA